MKVTRIFKSNKPLTDSLIFKQRHLFQMVCHVLRVFRCSSHLINMQNIHEENLLTKYIYNDDLYSETDEHGIDIITLRYTLL